MKRALGIASVVAVLLALLLPKLPAQAASNGTRDAGHGLVVPTDRGKVQGKAAEGTDQWLGIPYAGDQLRQPVRATGQRQRSPGG
jgi:hypothetical protein